MSDVDFEDLRELQAEKELDFYMLQPASFIEDEVRAGRYGNHNKIWEVIPQKCTLQSIGWDLFNILKSDEPHLIRFHCAEALIELSDAASFGINAAQLSTEEQFNVPHYLESLKNIIEKKLAAG